MSIPLHSITVRRLIKADRRHVFNAFSRSEAIAQWFSPSADISIEVLDFEFEVGGRYRLRYTMADGSHPVLGGEFHLIEPPARLAFSWIWEAPDPHAEAPSRVQISFFEREESTEIVLTHEQIPSEEIAMRHAEGWKATFDNLEGVLNKQ